MLKRVAVNGIQLPRLYIAENDQDVEIAMNNGIPFIKWKRSQEELLKWLLRPTLEKMFPHINWNKVLGRRRRFKSQIIICKGKKNTDKHGIADYDANEMLNAQLEHDNDTNSFADIDGEYSRAVPIADSERDICGGLDSDYEHFNIERLDIGDYVGDLSSCVDIDALQKLDLLPKFVGDIVDCIKLNLSENMRWNEGYTKKLGVPLGNFNNRSVLPNLVIIDVSASIPDGIAATMLTLADTLRARCNAELIITSARSGYYPIGSELPNPQTLREYYGRCNESYEFMAILRKYISGREFGHVISFGDYDNPGDVFDHYGWKTGKAIDMANTKVHAVHHYHTRREEKTGYAKWVHECCPGVEEHYDTSWCKIMK